MWVAAPEGSGSLEQAALLVLLAGAAVAGIVAAHLLSVGGPGLGPRGHRAPRRAIEVAAPRLLPLRRRALGHVGGRRVLLGHADLEELLDRRLFQAADHLLEHVEGFLLVLGQR